VAPFGLDERFEIFRLSENPDYSPLQIQELTAVRDSVS
jgi:hypothetical protein